MGHNLCLDLFGPPSTEEAAAGLTVHGEASIANFDIQSSGLQLTQKARLSLAGLQVERQIVLEGTSVRVTETVGICCRTTADCMDRARHPRASVPGEGVHAVPGNG